MIDRDLKGIFLNMKKRILTISSANMDLNMKVQVSPEKGRTVMGDSYSYVPGGKGANSATAVARLGADSVFCTALGKDANGETLINCYKKDGIDTSYIKRCDGVPTGLATVTVEADGANRICVFSGANSEISPSDASNAVNASDPDAVFCHFEIPFETVCAALELCAQKGIPSFVDAGPASSELSLEKLPPLTVFSPNETETEIYTGIAPNTSENCRLAAEALAERVKAKYIVLKLGGRGAGVYDCEKGGEVTVIPSYDIKVVDTTSAGDAFTAAMTLEYIRSGDIYRACRYGNVVGALTVSRAGAGDSIPTEEECETFISERGIKL